MKTYRQGDILLRKVGKIPEGAKVKQSGHVVLAYGESTGHSHHIESQSALLLEENGQNYLQLEQPETLLHEEHAAQQLEGGKYIVIRQREYSPEAIRQVND